MVGNNDVSSTFSGVIAGGGAVSLAKLGSGTLTLNGNHTYTGITTVSAGTLRINGSMNSQSTVVNAGAALGGNGSISGSMTVNVGGTLTPGTFIGTLTISGALMLSGNSHMEINKAGVALTGDLVTGVNTLTYGGTLTVTATGDPLAEGDTFNLFDAATFGGAFTSFNLPALASCLVWDTSKLTVDGTIKVTRDTVPPVISAAGGSATIACPAMPVFTPPTATDNSAPAPTIVEVGDITTPGACAGTYTRTKTWKAVDVCGNESGTVSQAITVADLTPPTIVCAGAKSVECGSSWTFDLPTASDTCGSATIIIVSTITNTAGHSGSNFAATRTWRATDSCGNTTNCSQMVTVVDTVAPVITCPTNISVFSTNTSGAMVGFVVTATDTCSGSLTPVCTPASGANFPVGITTVNCNAPDTSQNSSPCSFTVTVVLNQAPVAGDNIMWVLENRPRSVLTEKFLANDVDHDGDSLTIVAVTANSTNGGSVTRSNTQVRYTPAPNFVGNDQFTYTVSDGRGGQATANVVVHVLSLNDPSINRLGDLTVTPTSVRISFSGIPCFNYSVERSTSLPVWAPIGSFIVNDNGIVEFEDMAPPLGGAFYRTVVIE